VLAACAAAAASAALFYLPARGLWPVLLVGALHAALLAPAPPIADSLALASADPAGRAGLGFDYGRVRGAGAAAFILGSIVAGQAIERFGIEMAVLLHTPLLVATSLAAFGAPELHRPLPPQPQGDRGIGALFRLQAFRRLLLVAALIQGSHALHDSFAVIRWEAAGISPGLAGLFWSEAVAGEVIVFFLLGRPLLDRFGPAGASALAALAGVVRWSVMALTSWAPAVALVQPLHGLTFALQHLACMRLLAAIAPPRLAATALSVYGTVGVGIATTLLTLASGPLYARLGPQGFLAMAGLCAAALPLTRGLRQ
jgi:PPP family 3-phenylpropionic acid transporter